MKIIEQLGNESSVLRRQAYRAVRGMGPGVIPDLITGLDHANWRVRKSCAAIMDHVGDERCVKPLARALGDPVADVRRQAVHSLICDRCKTVPLDVDAIGLLIERATTDKSVRVRRRATTALASIPTYDKRTYRALRGLEADDDAETRRRASWSLNRLEWRKRKGPKVKK